MSWLKRVPPRLVVWLVILPIVIYILLMALNERGG